VSVGERSHEESYKQEGSADQSGEYHMTSRLDAAGYRPTTQGSEASRCRHPDRVKIRFLPVAGSGPERGWMRLAGVPVFRSYAAFTGVDPWSVNRSIG
jgi:hypothetical protein